MRTSFVALLLMAAIAVPAAAQDAVDQAKPGQTSTQKPAPPKPAPAQTAKPKPKPTPKLPLGFRGYFGVESTFMAASSTFDAVTGSSSVVGFGVGGELLNVWRKMFLRFGFTHASADGARGFVLDDGFQSTGVPLDVGVRTVELSAGWRTYLKKHPKFALYYGGGLLFSTVSQESPLATETDLNGSSTGTGVVGTFGFEYAASKHIVVGAEGQYRAAGGLGDSGISQGFNESGSGGFAIRAIVGYRFKK